MYIEFEVKNGRSMEVFQRIGFYTNNVNYARAVFCDAETFLLCEASSGNHQLDEDCAKDKYDVDHWVLASLLLQAELNGVKKTLTVDIYSHADGLAGFITRFRGIATTFGCREVFHHVS